MIRYLKNDVATKCYLMPSYDQLGPPGLTGFGLMT